MDTEGFIMLGVLLRSRSLSGRLNRLFRAMHPRLAHPEDALARALLSAAEFSVYERMDPRDREHATRVARRLLESHPDASDFLMRAALLHDCGKLVRPYAWLERVVAGLAQRPEAFPTTPLRADWQTYPFSALEVRFLHPVLGAALIREAGGDARVAEIVERHHHPDGDADAALIHAVDELE
jgi:HD domain